MNIKDPEVHAMARELAARRSTTVTDAVRQVLRAELERCPHPEGPDALEARTVPLLELLQRYKRLPWPDRRSSAELQDDLYDQHGLPL